MFHSVLLFMQQYDIILYFVYETQRHLLLIFLLSLSSLSSLLRKHLFLYNFYTTITRIHCQPPINTSELTFQLPFNSPAPTNNLKSQWMNIRVKDELPSSFPFMEAKARWFPPFKHQYISDVNQEMKYYEYKQRKSELHNVATGAYLEGSLSCSLISVRYMGLFTG